MQHEVIMPALGMAQDTGLLIAWCKTPGDRVKVGDVLFEVETDKSTMEVEAAHDGYLAELRAEAGDNVPVGEVIAVITPEKPDVPVERPAAKGAVPEVAGREAQTAPAALQATTALPPVRQPVESVAFAPAPAAVAKAAVPTPGRILASPKARRLAAERGLDLARLVAAGVKQPYHVADLDRAEAPPAAHAQPGPAPVPMHLSAAVAAEGLESFRAWLAAEVEAPVSWTAILAVFLTGAMRTVRDDPAAPLNVAVETPAGRVLYRDADVAGLAALQPAEAGDPVLLLHDLTTTRLDGARLGAAETPVLTLTRCGGDFRVGLETDAHALPLEKAIGLVSEFAARLETPLRQLL